MTSHKGLVGNYTGSIFSWKDAIISVGIAAGIAITTGAIVAYSFGVQLGNITTGFKFFFG